MRSAAAPTGESILGLAVAAVDDDDAGGAVAKGEEAEERGGIETSDCGLSREAVDFSSCAASRVSFCPPRRCCYQSCLLRLLTSNPPRRRRKNYRKKKTPKRTTTTTSCFPPLPRDGGPSPFLASPAGTAHGASSVRGALRLHHCCCVAVVRRANQLIIERRARRGQVRTYERGIKFKTIFLRCGTVITGGAPTLQKVNSPQLPFRQLEWVSSAGHDMACVQMSGAARARPPIVVNNIL